MGTEVSSELRLLLKRFLRRQLKQAEPSATPLVSSPDVAAKLRAILLLRAYGFPTERIHEVLACSRIDVAVCVEQFDRRFSSADAMKSFLAGGDLEPEPKVAPDAKPEKPSNSVAKAPSKKLKLSSSSASSSSREVPAEARDALEVLEYWTSRWLDDFTTEDKSEGKSDG